MLPSRVSSDVQSHSEIFCLAAEDWVWCRFKCPMWMPLSWFCFHFPWGTVGMTYVIQRSEQNPLLHETILKSMRPIEVPSGHCGGTGTFGLDWNRQGTKAATVHWQCMLDSRFEFVCYRPSVYLWTDHVAVYFQSLWWHSSLVTPAPIHNSAAYDDSPSLSCLALQKSYARDKSQALKQITMTNSTIPPDAILNPYTPLAFLPPDVADQYQVMCYVYVATLAVSFIKYWATAAYMVHFQAYTWDWLMSIPEEYKVIRKVGFTPPNIAYFVSRLVITYL